MGALTRAWLVGFVAGGVAATSIVLSAEASAQTAQTTVARRSPGEVGLLDAAESGSRATALRLLAKGANPNVAGPDGTTAVMYAANNDLELVRALIKAGANVKLKNELGTSALTEAAIIGSTPIIEALLKAGADPNTRNPEGETPWVVCARTAKVEAV